MSKASAHQINRLKSSIPFHLIILPGVLATLIFSYIPMYGIVMAFQSYNPTKSMFAQKWVGIRYFKMFFKLDDFYELLRNTLWISSLKILTILFFSLILALLLNELRKKFVRSTIQSFLIFPYFLSWVILGGMIKSLFANDGAINAILKIVGLEPVYFMGDPNWFLVVLIITNLWQGVGFSAILFTAAISGVDGVLYEAARMDGANRLQQTWHITIKSILPFIILLLVLNIGGIFNAGFDQIINLYNGNVISTSDVIDTYVYRVGLQGAEYSFGTAVGLFKSVISCILVGISYFMADKFANYRIF